MAPTPTKPRGCPPGPKQPRLAAALAKDGWLTPSEAARVSGTPLSTVYGWVTKQVLRTQRAGLKRVFVHAGDLKTLCGPAYGKRA